MTKAEAAAAWAEAMEALEMARKAEEAAWEALRAIAGRGVDAGPVSESALVPGHARAFQTWQEQTVPIPPKVVG